MRVLKGLLVLILVTAGVAVLVLYRLGAPRHPVVSIEKIHARQGLPVRVAHPKRVPMADYLYCDGSVEADVRAVLRAKVAEMVEAVNARVGEHVRKGQVLVVFRKTDLEAAVQAARAAYQEAANDYRRQQQLFEQHVISQERLERARTAKENAAAVLRAAESRLKFAEMASPIDGVVETRTVEPGEFKGVGKELMTIVDLSTVQVRALVPDRDVPGLAPGGKAEFALEAAERWLPARIWRIGPSSTDPNRFFDVFLKVRNERNGPEWLMRPGMYAQVRFVHRSVPDALTVPNEAIVYEGGEMVVYAVEQNKELVAAQGPPAGPQQEQADNGFLARLRRGLERIRPRRPGPRRSEAVPQVERLVSRARRLVVKVGLQAGGRTQLLAVEGASLDERSLVVLNPLDEVHDGSLLKIVEPTGASKGGD